MAQPEKRFKCGACEVSIFENVVETKDGKVRRYGLSVGEKFYIFKISNDEIFSAQPFQLPVLGIKIRPSLLILMIFIPLVLLVFSFIYLLRTKKAATLPESRQLGWAILDSAGYIKKYNHTSD